LTFVEIRSPSEKALSANTLAPTMGIDVTLPQHRISHIPKPAQDEYPVPYFFYGTLAHGPKLIGLLGLDLSPVLEPAVLQRGKLKTWGGKYRALVDGDDKGRVEGWMYLVQNRQHEDALRDYEGDNYEVARCEIFGVESGKLFKGLTFRFCGGEEMLC
jgi:hypothetical protein